MSLGRGRGGGAGPFFLANPVENEPRWDPLCAGPSLCMCIHPEGEDQPPGVALEGWQVKGAGCSWRNRSGVAGFALVGAWGTTGQSHPPSLEALVLWQQVSLRSERMCQPLHSCRQCWVPPQGAPSTARCWLCEYCSGHNECLSLHAATNNFTSWCTK